MGCCGTAAREVAAPRQVKHARVALTSAPIRVSEDEVVAMEAVKGRNPRVDTVLGLTKAEDVAVEVQKQDILNMNNPDGARCFVCNGSGKRKVEEKHVPTENYDPACPQCTFINSPDRTRCEICNGALEIMAESPVVQRTDTEDGDEYSLISNEQSLLRIHTRVITKRRNLLGEELDVDAGDCWVCNGTGRISAFVGALERGDEKNGSGNDDDEVEADDEFPCGVCWGPSKFGLSKTCNHFFCKQCLKDTLQDCLDNNRFPAFCPACLAEAAGDDSDDEGSNGKKILERKGGKGSSEPPVGYISESVLTFLVQRGVINEKLQHRFMRYQNEEKREYFPCPARCGNVLYQREFEFKGSKKSPVLKPGRCPCGQLLCLRCRRKHTPGHYCPVRTHLKGADFDDETIKRICADSNTRACPICSLIITKNQGCHVMMCGAKAHSSVKAARDGGGCGYEGSWNSFVRLKPSFFKK